MHFGIFLIQSASFIHQPIKANRGLHMQALSGTGHLGLMADPLAGKSDHHLNNNSKHLAKEMISAMEEDEMFISHDVVSLFTNTPIDLPLHPGTVGRGYGASYKNAPHRWRHGLIEVHSDNHVFFQGHHIPTNVRCRYGEPSFPASIANLFMEWLEKQAIATAPVECKPKFWKRYVNDVLELIKQGQVRNLTDHINTIDSTGNIQFTYMYEEEEDKQIPFLDTLLVRRKDGSVKLLVYRKKSHSHTDQ